MSQSVKTPENPKPKDPKKYKEAVTLGKKLSKTPDVTKVEVATQMYELIHIEGREVIAMAFVEGANPTPKGAMTYFHNCRRKFKKNS